MKIHSIIYTFNYTHAYKYNHTYKHTQTWIYTCTQTCKIYVNIHTHISHVRIYLQIALKSPTKQRIYNNTNYTQHISHFTPPFPCFSFHPLFFFISSSIFSPSIHVHVQTDAHVHASISTQRGSFLVNTIFVIGIYGPLTRNILRNLLALPHLPRVQTSY